MDALLLFQQLRNGSKTPEEWNELANQGTIFKEIADVIISSKDEEQVYSAIASGLLLASFDPHSSYQKLSFETDLVDQVFLFLQSNSFDFNRLFVCCDFILELTKHSKTLWKSNSIQLFCQLLVVLDSQRTFSEEETEQIKKKLLLAVAFIKPREEILSQICSLEHSQQLGYYISSFLIRFLNWSEGSDHNAVLELLTHNFDKELQNNNAYRGLVDDRDLLVVFDIVMRGLRDYGFSDSLALGRCNCIYSIIRLASYQSTKYQQNETREWFLHIFREGLQEPIKGIVARIIQCLQEE